MTDYRLDVYNTAGTLVAKLTDFSNLAFTRRVNTPGVVTFTVRGDHPILATLADKYQIEVWRKPDDTDTWGREITGIYRALLPWTYSDQSTAVVFCNGLMSMLDWRIVAWKAGTTSRSKFTSAKAETIANTLVKYNATTSASIIAGRIRDGTISGLTVEADGAEGNTIDWFCSYATLLEQLQAISKVGGGDFDLVKTNSTAWQWRWYTGQLGTDRSASVTFSLERGNMANPVYMDNRTQEKTVAIVGGQGEGADRVTVVRTGANYSATNDIEMFVDATDIDTTAGLNTRGDQALAEVEAVKSFAFTVLQIPSCMYGTHYTVGDKVKAINPYNGTEYTVKVNAAVVGLNPDGSETIAIEMSEPQ